jgi:predicted DNA binding CopG/RHH family protein
MKYRRLTPIFHGIAAANRIEPNYFCPLPDGAAINGNIDELAGLKENVIMGADFTCLHFPFVALILDSFEKGEWVPVKNLPRRRAELMKYARNTLKKDKRLTEIQRKAVSEGLPYRTYVSSIIHEFIGGRLREAKN